MTRPFDAIVVGSGPSGAQAACRLVDSGLQVALVDIGNTDNEYAHLVPDASFSEIRQADPDQRIYFLGKNEEGIPSGSIGVAAQLTPPRQYVVRDNERWLRRRSETFDSIESVALGGLGAAWGAGCFTYDRDELDKAGLDDDEMQPHYETVAERIGVSGPQQGSFARRACRLPNLLPPLEIDSNAESILAGYEKKSESLNRRGLFMGRTPLAVLSRDYKGRQANPYFDMDFWSDSRGSVYRPQYTIEELKRRDNFIHIPRSLVVRFTESPVEGAQVYIQNVDTEQQHRLSCRRLVLAAGALGSARIALRSLEQYNVEVPVLSNPYSYLVCVNLRMLGRAARDRRHSLAQLSILLDDRPGSGESISAQIFSYRSLLLFRLVQQMPLPVWAGLQAARILVSSLAIVGVHHADSSSPLRRAALRRESERDCLEINYLREEERLASERSRRAKLAEHLIGLGCVPLRSIPMRYGSSIHYAGTLPVSAEDRPLTTTPQGRLRGTQNVFVADGSVLAFLPAKGLTFTIMANADRIAKGIAEQLR